MTITEVNSLMKFKDKDGNITAIYPTAKADNVEGLDAVIRNQSVTTDGDGAAYTASVDGILALTAGISFVMIPHVASTTASPTLNVNGLGAMRIRRGLSTNTSTTSAGAASDWLSAGKPIRVTYDGTFWIADRPRPSATDLMGTVPITNGGTGGTTAADARKNLGAVSMVTATVTLTASGWSNNGQLVSCSGVTASNTVIVSPVTASHTAYVEAEVRCSYQTVDKIGFVCVTAPTEDLTVNVVILA